ncbi:MAG TPA: glutamine synthetase family protein, partial [Pseudomonadales bacterium]|nr:glutamine synthetase family protein [Pseudomonadales bacterium]
MTVNQTELARVNALIAEHKVRFINMQFSDIVGIVKQVTIPISQWPDAVSHGVWFDGSSIEGFARIAESDMYLVPDLETFAVIPWDDQALPTARVICDVYMPNGTPFWGDPRYVLKRVLAEANELGFTYKTGPELEFFLFKLGADGLPTTQPHDEAGYFDVSTDLAHSVRRRMVETLEALGIEVESTHHEVAVGQHEIDFRYDNALRTADNVITLRTALKAIAQRSGLHCTFMPKPLTHVNGSGMHTHQSLFDTKTGKNLFAASSAQYGLSERALQFLAGQLDHARGMSVIIAPLVNSYKRLVPGFEAPVYITWARTNRSSLIRVPRVNPERVIATRLELRCPDPSANPYLAFAVMLAAGLDGIRRKLKPPEPAEENLYQVDVARRNLTTM